MQRLASNAFYNGLQILLTTICIFLLYRYTVVYFGLELLGVWALVFAFAGAGRLAEMGFCGAVVRHTGRYAAEGQHRECSSLMWTAAATVAGAQFALILPVYLFREGILAFIIGPDNLSFALVLFPLALLTLVLTSVSSILLASVEGYRDYRTSAIIRIIGALVQVLVFFALVKLVDFRALGYAAAGAALGRLTLAGMAFGAVMHRVNGHAKIAISKKSFRELLGFGVPLQLSSFLATMGEPLVKVLLSRFGSMETVGLFEVAGKVVGQFRGLLVAANQALVPTVSGLSPEQSKELKTLYLTALKVSLIVGGPGFIGLVAVLPSLGEFLTAGLGNRFQLFGYMLAAGWFLNFVTVPAYFFLQGLGILRWNLAGHCVIAGGNLVFGIAAGIFLGGAAVVGVWSVLVAVGGMISIVALHHRLGLRIAAVFGKPDFFMSLASLLCLGAIVLVNAWGERSGLVHEASALAGLVAGSLMTVGVIFHPAGKLLRSRAQQQLIKIA
jgi:O-antigen/teichoic acid export membrane protein